MSLPENRIKKVKLPNNTEYEIIPEKISDGSGNYTTLPNLNDDNGKIAINNIDNNFTATQTFLGSIGVNDIYTTDNNEGLYISYDASQGTAISTPGHFIAYGNNDDSNTNKPDDETGFSDLDADYFNTGITLRDSGGSENNYRLSFPAKSGVFATTDDITNIEIVDLTQINN